MEWLTEGVRRTTVVNHSIPPEKIIQEHGKIESNPTCHTMTWRRPYSSSFCLFLQPYDQ